MQEWNNDNELIELVKTELYTAVVGDICDELGYKNQFLSQTIQPLDNSKTVPIMVGRAMTVLEVNVFEEPKEGLPFGKMLDALDNIQKNEIYICAGAGSYATIGELMCTAMIARGGVGAVSDSFIRDVEGIKKLGFPVYSKGFYARDQRGRGIVLDYRVPIKINEVTINDQDLIIGDIDGVLIIPKNSEKEIIAKSLIKARGEKTVQEKIKQGMLAKEAFEKYGIL